MSRDAEPDARQLTAHENAELCAGCVLCCTYITIEVDAPRQSWEYDQCLWMLHHEGIEMYVERPEKWFVNVATRCRQLERNGRCAIYGRHPVLCREYDPRSCERRAPLSDIRAWFKDAAALEHWLQRHRPAHWARLERYRAAPPAMQDSISSPSGLVQIAGLLSPLAGTRSSD